LNSELVEFSKSFDDLREKTRLIVRELKSCAKNEDVMMLQKYVNLWDPVKFATLNDVERIMNEKVEDKIEDMHLKIQEEKFIEEKVREEVKQALRELALNKRMNQ
jgi:DNA primase